jgi:hypothetical protein
MTIIFHIGFEVISYDYIELYISHLEHVVKFVTCK